MQLRRAACLMRRRRATEFLFNFFQKGDTAVATKTLEKIKKRLMLPLIRIGDYVQIFRVNFGFSFFSYRFHR
jgi:hypothetical protein